MEDDALIGAINDAARRMHKNLADDIGCDSVEEVDENGDHKLVMKIKNTIEPMPTIKVNQKNALGFLHGLGYRKHKRK